MRLRPVPRGCFKCSVLGVQQCITRDACGFARWKRCSGCFLPRNEAIISAAGEANESPNVPRCSEQEGKVKSITRCFGTASICRTKIALPRVRPRLGLRWRRSMHLRGLSISIRAGFLEFFGSMILGVLPFAFHTVPSAPLHHFHNSSAHYLLELEMNGKSFRVSGGERGIRTLDRVSPIHAFQACAFNHSAISPVRKSARH